MGDAEEDEGGMHTGQEAAREVQAGPMPAAEAGAAAAAATVSLAPAAAREAAPAAVQSQAPADDPPHPIYGAPAPPSPCASPPGGGTPRAAQLEPGQAGTPGDGMAGSSAHAQHRPLSSAQVREAVAALPGSPVPMARLRAGLPPGPFPDPNLFTAADWDRQGHEVRAILSHTWVGSEMFCCASWGESWHRASDFAGHDELVLYQQRLGAAGDSTDVVAIAQQQRDAQQQEEEEQEEEQQRRQRHSGQGSRGSRSSRHDSRGSRQGSDATTSQPARRSSSRLAGQPSTA